jgi:uridylate kinase
MPKTSKSFIVSLGGSLVVPDKVDSKFLKSFRNLIQNQIKKSRRFVIIVGGGKVAREYAKAAKDLGDLNPNDLDWLGIHATRLNAHLLRTVLKRHARPRIVTNPHNKSELSDSGFKVIVAAGYRPGFSTDYCATILAKQYGITELLNLSNIDYVYDKDPSKHKNATPQKFMDWKAFRKLVGNKWDPGLNSPFDPIAAKLAQKLKLKVAILNGRKFRNLESYLNGEKFEGTVIQ